MELEWKWNGKYLTEKKNCYGMEMEWKWNGNGMEKNTTNQEEKKIDGMECKWNGNGMEKLEKLLWKWNGMEMEWRWK